MPVRRLPANPSLEHLRHQAKDLLREHSACISEVAQRIREFHPRFSRCSDRDIFDAHLSLHDAQLTIAREHGFTSWPRLKNHIVKPAPSGRLDLKHHERIEDKTFRRAVDLLDAGDAAGLAAWLKQHPGLVHRHILFEGANYFHDPTLLEFVAENPVRHGALPTNILAVTRVILDAGADRAARNETLALVATGSVPRECGVQLPLIELLCQHGADPGTAVHATAIHGELEALHALLRLGARVDLPVAAALGRLDALHQLLPGASSEDRHLALALAVQFGHVEIVRRLLDTGENPDRFDPVGGHSHGTPLHHAAGGGQDELVRLLVERGARLDQRDVLWHATPADWAAHQGKTEIEAYLRAQEKLSRSG